MAREEKNEICERCGSLNNFKYIPEGLSKTTVTFWFLIFLIIIGNIAFSINLYFATTLILFIFFVGMVHILTSKDRRVAKKCLACDTFDTALNVETPKGKELFNKYHTDEK